MNTRVRYGLWILLISTLSAPAQAMTPAAMVAEIAIGAADEPLAPCENLRVRQGEIQIGEKIARWIETRKGKHPPWHAPPPLRQLEDMHFLLLLRSPETCEALLDSKAEGRIPDSWQNHLPFRAWRIEAETIRLFGTVETSIAARRRKVVPLSVSDKPPLRIYHHGRLEVHRGMPTLLTHKMEADESAHIHLEGPGDEVRFVFQATQAGSLIVERTPGNMPNLDARIGTGERDPQPRGMMNLQPGKKALIVFRYTGAEPLELDVGFLFTPDPLACEMTLTSTEQGYRATVTIRNVHGAPTSIFKPSSGTVEWYADDKLIAAARSARLPERLVLAPGTSVVYQVHLQPPSGETPTQARIQLDNPTASIWCTSAENP